eukprot:scaffold602_cov179-Ochromonas_danica.AAC.15
MNVKRERRDGRMSSPSFLIVLLDLESLLSYVNSRASSGSLTVSSLIHSLLPFLHSFAFQHRENRLAFLTHGLSSTKLIYPQTDDSSSAKMSYLPHLPVLSQVVVEKVAVAVEEERELLHTKKSSKRHLSSALSTALTIVRQQQQDQQEQEGVGSRTQARVLLLQFDKDRPQNYNALMNCIFSAQKMEVVVDALLCSSFDSHLLQQVCFLAEGLYVRHGDGGDLAAMLTTYFLADRKTRQLLSNPSQPPAIAIRSPWSSHICAVFA